MTGRTFLAMAAAVPLLLGGSPTNESAGQAWEVRITSHGDAPFVGTVATGYSSDPSMQQVSGENLSLSVVPESFVVLVAAGENSSVEVEVWDGDVRIASAKGPRVMSGQGIPPGSRRFATAF